MNENEIKLKNLGKIKVEVKKFYEHPVVGMALSWPSIVYGHSGITAHLETTTFNAYETLNLGV